MKIIISTVLVFISISSFCQENYNKLVDEKKGFKEFTIGDDIEKWIDNVEYTNSEGDVKYYRYRGSCCSKVFDFDLGKIRLGFENNKLKDIFLVTLTKKDDSDEWISDEFYQLKSEFEYYFEEKTNILLVPGTDKSFSSWEGENIELYLTFNPLGLKKIDDVWSKISRCTVLVTKREIVKKGF